MNDKAVFTKQYEAMGRHEWHVNIFPCEAFLTLADVMKSVYALKMVKRIRREHFNTASRDATARKFQRRLACSAPQPAVLRVFSALFGDPLPQHISPLF